MKISPDEQKIYEKVFDLYIQNEKYPSEEELSNIEFSPEFEEKMERLIKEEKTFKAHTSRKVMQAVASFVVVLALVAGGFAVGTLAEPSNPEITIKEIIELHNSVIYETESKGEYIYGPSYVPEGYFESYGISNDYTRSSEGYANKEGDRILFIRYWIQNPIPEIDRFGVEYEIIDNGLYILNPNTGKSRYIWSNLGYVFELRADNCSKEELFKMRDSLVRK